MKVRPFLAARAAAGAILLAVTVAACTTGGSASSAPSIFTPSPSATPTGTSTALKTPTVGNSASPSPLHKSSAKATHTSSAKATHTPSAKAIHTPSAKATHKATAIPTITINPSHHRATSAPRHTKVPVASPYPTGAPETGGGGTAGLQDGLLFGVGGAAIVAGLGSLGYRRRLRRKQRAASAARTEDREHTAIR